MKTIKTMLLICLCCCWTLSTVFANSALDAQEAKEAKIKEEAQKRSETIDPMVGSVQTDNTSTSIDTDIDIEEPITEPSISEDKIITQEEGAR